MGGISQDRQLLGFRPYSTAKKEASADHPEGIRSNLRRHLSLKYYEHHLGDYLRDTMHLSLIEDGAYMRLLAAYYSRELPIPKDRTTLYRLIRADSKAEKVAVNTVLKGFFTLSSDGWHHSRCDQEIARYHEKRRKAQNSANARWKSCDGNANALRTQCDGNALQSPITNNQSLKNPEGQNGLSRKEQLMNAVRKTAQGMKTKESP